jgi:hypothetical protein
MLHEMAEMKSKLKFLWRGHFDSHETNGWVVGMGIVLS